MSKSKKLLTEINNIVKRVNNLPDYRKQPVLTTKMTQAIVNDMYNMKYVLQQHMDRILEDLNISPNHDSLHYDCHPSCNEFVKRKPKKNKQTVDEILEEYGEYGDGMDDDADAFLDGWIKTNDKGETDMD